MAYRSSLELGHGRLALLAFASLGLLLMVTVSGLAVVLGAWVPFWGSVLVIFMFSLFVSTVLGSASVLMVLPVYALRYIVLAATVGHAVGDADSVAAALRAWQAIPDVLVFAMAASHGLRSQLNRSHRARASNWPFTLTVVLTLILMVAFLMSDAALANRFAYARSFMGPLLVVLLGFTGRARGTHFAHALMSTVTVAVLFGAVVYAFGGVFGWAWAQPYFSFRHGGFSTALGYPGIWSTVFFDVRFLRFGAGFLDPIALGYWAAVAALLALRYRSWALTALFATLTGVTAAKGAWILLAAGGLIYLLLVTRHRPTRWVFRSLLVALLIVIPRFVDEGKGSFRVHVSGLVEGSRAAATKPLGHGLGAGGNWAGILGNADTSTATGAESAVGVIAYQLGFVGLVFLLIAFTAAIVRLRRLGKQPWCRPDAALGTGILCAGAILLLFQENILSVSASFPVWFMIGIALSGRAADAIGPALAGAPDR
jgi:hypothetical protein